MNSEREDTTLSAVAGCCETAMDHVVVRRTFRTEEDQLGGRCRTREADRALPMCRAFTDIGRLYRAAGLVISHKWQLASATGGTAFAPAHSFIVKSLATLAHVEPGEWLAENAFFPVERADANRALRQQIVDEPAILGRVRVAPWICCSDQFVAEGAAVDGRDR